MVLKVSVERGVLSQPVGKLTQFFFLGQLTIKNKIRNFCKSCFGGQFLYRIAPIPEDAVGSIDIGDR